MEQYDIDSNLSNYQLVITEEIKRDLSETAKWGTFIAIVGFIGVGFMVIAAVGMMVFMSTMSSISPDTGSPFGIFGGGILGGFYLILAALYFFPVLYLYKFSSKMKMALNGDDDVALHDAFKNLKSVYKFLGIMTIAFIALYGLFFVIGLLGGMASLVG